MGDEEPWLPCLVHSWRKELRSFALRCSVQPQFSCFSFLCLSFPINSIVPTCLMKALQSLSIADVKGGGGCLAPLEIQPCPPARRVLIFSWNVLGRSQAQLGAAFGTVYGAAPAS